MIFSPRGTTVARGNSLLLLTVANVFQIVYSLDNTCNVDDIARQDCGWSGITLKNCQARNCCWKTPTTSGAPWCFFDSATAVRLYTVKACEHHSPVSLQCNENETISIHDVFYGRNNGDPLCHRSGTTTCFNPNATEIIRNLCKNNSTCFISPRGKKWDFDKSCDALNAQLIIHFLCTSRDRKLDAISSALEGGITATPSYASRMYTASSLAIASTFHIKTVIPSKETPTISSVLWSDKATPSITVGTSTKQTCTCPDVAALSIEIERKDRIIIGLSALLILLALVAVLWVVLLCRKNNWYKVMEKRGDVVHMESTHFRKEGESKPGSANSTYDDVDLQNENNTYDGVHLQNENNTYDGVHLEDENPYYASN